MSPSTTLNMNPSPTPNELHRQLAYLNLTFMQQNLEELARQAAEKQWSHVDFLSRLVEGEADLRQDRARIRRIRDARFPVLKTLEPFRVTGLRPPVTDLLLDEENRLANRELLQHFQADKHARLVISA